MTTISLNWAIDSANARFQVQATDDSFQIAGKATARVLTQSALATAALAEVIVLTSLYIIAALPLSIASKSAFDSLSNRVQEARADTTKAFYSILSSQSQTTTKPGKFEQAKALVSNIANRTLNLGKTSLRAIQTHPKASMLVALVATVTAVAYAYGMHNSVMNYFSPPAPKTRFFTDLRNSIIPGLAGRSFRARLMKALALSVLFTTGTFVFKEGSDLLSLRRQVIKETDQAFPSNQTRDIST